MKKFLVFLSVLFVRNAYADTETIKWYVDGSIYNTTTCQSGGDITLQTAPDKRGHRFTGWEVALYDFSTLDPSVAGTSYTQNPSAYTWATTFPYGVVSGKALCSITSGPYAEAGTPDESTSGEYCWCKATVYKPTSSDINYWPSPNLAWVFAHNYGSDCASLCASDCGYRVRNNTAFRQAVFGITE